MRRKLISSIFLFLACCCAFGQSSQARKWYFDSFWPKDKAELTDEYLPAWKEGWMDLHSISTSVGEGQFYVLPDGTTMLVDCGEKERSETSMYLPDSTKSVGEWILAYIRHFSPHPEKTDYLWITHFHSDHIASGAAMVPGRFGFKVAGVLRVAEEMPFGTIVDRGYPSYDYPSAEFIRKQFPAISHYRKMTEYQVSSFGARMEEFKTGSSTQFGLLHNPRKFKNVFKIQNIASCGYKWTGKGLNTEPLYDTQKYSPEKLGGENAMSSVITIEYGKFKYYNGGDLPGGSKSMRMYETMRFESKIAPLCAPVTVMKVDHHAWSNVCPPDFLAAMKPQAMIICSHGKQSPYETTFNRLIDPYVYPDMRRLFITTPQARETLGEEKFRHFKPWGHIVVRVYEGGLSYQVYVLDARTTDYKVIYQTGVINL